MKCFVCGKPIPQKFYETCSGYVSVGRPKTYCSSSCRYFQKYFIAAQKALDGISLDDLHKRKIRGELFRLANTLVLSSSFDFSTKNAPVEKA